jgi:hypothetical protein
VAPTLRRVSHPFPEPEGLDGRRELFDTDHIAAWLAATGQGNNHPDH